MSTKLVITAVFAHHAAMLKYYAFRRGMQAPGVEGTYGPVHPETGAPYKVLGVEDRDPKKSADQRKISHTSNTAAGPFYPETLFIYGENQESGDNLPAAVLEAFVKELRAASICHPVILLRGYAKGQPNWQDALQYTPETKHVWYELEGLVRTRFPAADVERQHLGVPNLTIADLEYPFTPKEVQTHA